MKKLTKIALASLFIFSLNACQEEVMPSIQPTVLELTELPDISELETVLDEEDSIAEIR